MGGSKGLAGSKKPTRDEAGFFLRDAAEFRVWTLPFPNRDGLLPSLRIDLNLNHESMIAFTRDRAAKRAKAEARDGLRLGDVPLGEAVELVDLDLPEAELETLLERGVLPGCRMCPIRRSPSGDPIVDVEGTVLALRREMAACLCVRRYAEHQAAS